MTSTTWCCLRSQASISSSKTIWRDEQRVARLIELAIAEFNTGCVKNGKLGAPNYESIAAITRVDVPSLDEQKIKTKLDNLRNEFRMFEDLKSRTDRRKYAKFMGRGLDHYDNLSYIFGNNTASGLYRYAPAQDPATSNEERHLYDAARTRSVRSDLVLDTPPFTPSEASRGTSSWRQKHPSPTPSSAGSRKMRSGESQHDSFEEASENFLNVRAERIASSNLSRRSLVDQYVDALMAIQPPIGQKAIGRAMDKIIQSATFRQTFLRSPWKHVMNMYFTKIGFCF
ncbi:hypothetical protein CJ030_MR1G027809 [Morella rubra]|uniref:Myb/SANT-like domain-containing protein n=1 Tax=Morella rubra TaxID=262757 RepID=A0A6A1WLM1_9ROSI|nr:hypothetical protein CJ030_MR1G027809 [Morella rubra]